MQGGKIRRLDVATKDVATIPFTAKVHRTLSQMARNEFRITDGPLAVKFFRWPTSTPDGATIAFQAVGHIWAAGRRERHAASADAERRSISSSTRRRGVPTGATLAFVTWDDTGRGHVWKVPAARRRARASDEGRGRLRRSGVESGRSFGDRRARRRRDGASANAHAQRVVRSRSHLGDAGRRRRHRRRARDDHAAERLGDLRRVAPADGASVGRTRRANLLDRRGGRARAEGAAARRCMSVKPDGSDKQEHLSFPAADEIVPSPDGAYVAFQEGDNVYVAADGVGRHRRRGAARREAPRAIPGHAAHARRRTLPALARREDARVRQRHRTTTCGTWTRTAPTRSRSSSACRATCRREALRSPMRASSRSITGR